MKKNEEANPAQASAPINRRDLLAMTARETRYSARNDAGRRTGERGRQPAGHDHSHERPLLGAEGGADAEFAGLLHHRVRQHAVQSNGGSRQRVSASLHSDRHLQH